MPKDLPPYSTVFWHSKKWRAEGVIEEIRKEISDVIISDIAQQLQILSDSYSDYDWQGHSITNYRAAIRKLFGFRIAKVADGEEMVDWLKAEIIPNEQRIEPITELVDQRFQELQIEPPTPDRSRAETSFSFSPRTVAKLLKQ